MKNFYKKGYYMAKRHGVIFALHCTSRDAQLLSYTLEDVQPCSKAEYQAARESGARCYADAMEIMNHR